MPVSIIDRGSLLCYFENGLQIGHLQETGLVCIDFELILIRTKFT